MLAANLKTNPIVAEISSTRIMVPPKRFHSPIHESVNIACNVNRKYEMTTISKPTLNGVKNFCSDIKSTKHDSK